MDYSCNIYLAEDDTELKLFLDSVYREKGIDCISLIPDTVSVIIENGNNHLLKKGAFSSAPVFYHSSSAGFFCDFTIKGILNQLPFFPKPNSDKIQRYLDFTNEISDSNNLTFYEGVWRVLPGEVIIVADGGLQFFLADKIDLTANVPLYEQNIADIRKYFIDSVNNKIIGRNKIAANLSGGLDSSGVTGVAQSLRQDTVISLYAETRSKETDEYHYAEKVSEKHSTDLQKVSTQLENLMSAVKRVMHLTALPETSNVFSALNLGILDACVANKVDTLLSGILGDQVIDYGYSYFDELAKKRQWKQLEEVLRQHKHTEASKDAVIIKMAVKELIKRKRPLNAWSLYRQLHVDVGIKRSRLVRKVGELVFNKIQGSFSKDPLSKLISSLVLNKRRIAVKMHKPADLTKGMVSETAKRMTRGIYQHVAVEALEQMYLLWNTSNIAVRYPFLDRKLIQTTLRSENEWKVRNGVSRSTLREALKDFYPDEVYQRRSKAVFTNYLIETYRQFFEAFKIEYGEGYYSHQIWSICNRAVFEELSDSILNKEIKSAMKPKGIFLVFRVLYLAMWLDYVRDEEVKAVSKRSA